MATLPSLTESIDDQFVSTWYEIRKDAIDNILDSNIITAALREQGCFTPQVGGRFITRTIKYGTKSSTDIGKGSTLSSGEDDIETMAMWTWRYSHTHIQRSMVDDQVNSGPSAIKSLVATKLQAARDALDTGIETDFTQDNATASAGAFDATSVALEQSHTAPQGLFSVTPREANWDASEYYGTILRDSTNTWWRRQGNKDTAGTGDIWDTPRDIYLLANMRSTFNYCGRGSDFPNLLITDQPTFELYEDFAEDKTQIIRQTSTNLANLGFEVLQFKGRPIVWSPTFGTSGYGKAGDMLFLNTKYIEIVYDPNMWFEMTKWKEIPLQAERIAHIFIAWNMICSQPRRQGMRYTTA